MELSSEQRQILNKLYKNGAKVVRSKAHISFISKCLENKVIPVKFKVKNTLPGNQNFFQEKLNCISFESMSYEKQRHFNVLNILSLLLESR